VIVVLRGGLDITSAPALREKLLGFLRPSASRLIVDLSAVGYADASGLAVLVGAGRRAGLLGGWLRLASPTPVVARVLSATGLDRHLPTFPTVADAIAGRRPDVGTAEAETGGAGHVAPIRPAAALARAATPLRVSRSRRSLAVAGASSDVSSRPLPGTVRSGTQPGHGRGMLSPVRGEHGRRPGPGPVGSLIRPWICPDVQLAAGSGDSQGPGASHGLDPRRNPASLQ
jgi:anti-anti-sigma factor